MREIDALDGVMGEVADKSGIQFRLLNRSRGPAVRGPRTQSDRSLYRKFMQEKLANYCNLSIFSGFFFLISLNSGKYLPACLMIHIGFIVVFLFIITS